MVIILVLCSKTTVESWPTEAYGILALTRYRRLRSFDEVSPSLTLLTTPNAERISIKISDLGQQRVDAHELELHLVCSESCGRIQLTYDRSKGEIETDTCPTSCPTSSATTPPTAV